MTGKKERCISSQSDQQPFMVNLEMEVEEEGEQLDRSISLDEGINEEDNDSYSQNQPNSTEESSNFSNSLDSLGTDSTDASLSPSFNLTAKIPSISIISPTPTELPQKTGFARFNFSNSQNVNGKSLDQQKQKTETKQNFENKKILDNKIEKTANSNRKEFENDKSSCCRNGHCKGERNSRHSCSSRSSPSSDDSSLSSSDNNDISLEMCQLTIITTTAEITTDGNSRARETKEEEVSKGEDIKNAPRHDDLTENDHPPHGFDVANHHHRSRHHQKKAPVHPPSPQASLYGPEQQPVTSSLSDDPPCCDETIISSDLSSQTPSAATMPMAINSMDKCSKLWRTDPTEPFPSKARPKPIKFDIPSAAKTMASYFRLPSPASPMSAGTLPQQGVFSIGNDPIIRGESDQSSQATLQVSSQQTLPPSASTTSFMTNLSGLSSTPSQNPSPFSQAPPPNNFVPIYISTKDLEAAFLNEPPPQYVSGNSTLATSDRKKVQMASYMNNNTSSTPSAYNSINAKHMNQIKRNQSFQGRLQRAFWGSDADEGGHQQPSQPKAALSARMSIMGKPLKQPRNKSLRLMKQRIWVYNFLQRPRGVLSITYHLAVAVAIILNLLFFALSTVSYLEPQSMSALRALDIIILSILTLEFLALCWASSCVGKYQGLQGKVRFILLSPFRLLDLLIIGVTAVVVWTCWLNSHQAYLQWLRCGMIFQILRLEHRFKPWRMISSVLWIERKHLLITLYMGFLVLVTISYVVFFLEQDDPETLFTNIPVSLYWGVITMCTIGYGDLAPKTTAGRTVGALLAICGAVIYAIPAGIIATGLALKVQERNREKHINKRRIPAVRLIQCAWRVYAASQNSTSLVTWWAAQKAVANGGARGGGLHRKLLDMYNGSQFNLMDDGGDGDHHHHSRSTSASKQNSHSDLHTLHHEGILSGAQKNAVRFIRAAQYEVALRQFKNAFKPYDIKDVLQQYSEGHSDVVGRVRCMQSGINTVHVGLSGVMKMMVEMQRQQTEKIDRLEATVGLLLQRLAEEKDGGDSGGDNHPNSPYNYSETSTIYVHTPTQPPPIKRKSSENILEDESKLKSLKEEVSGESEHFDSERRHHHNRNNSS